MHVFSVPYSMTKHNPAQWLHVVTKNKGKQSDFHLDIASLKEFFFLYLVQLRLLWQSHVICIGRWQRSATFRISTCSRWDCLWFQTVQIHVSQDRCKRFLKAFLLIWNYIPGSIASCDLFLSSYEKRGLARDVLCPCAWSSEALTVAIKRYYYYYNEQHFIYLSHARHNTCLRNRRLTFLKHPIQSWRVSNLLSILAQPSLFYLWQTFKSKCALKATL